MKFNRYPNLKQAANWELRRIALIYALILMGRIVVNNEDIMRIWPDLLDQIHDNLLRLESLDGNSEHE